MKDAYPHRTATRNGSIRPSTSSVGNAVGRFIVGEIGSLVVRCGKWDQETFDTLLVELTEVALALPYAADQSAGLPHDRTLVENNAILLHAFLYARHILLGSKRELTVGASMAAVFADPHRRFLGERDAVPLHDARRVDARSIARLAAGMEPMARAPGSLGGLPLAKTLRGHLPTRVDVPRAHHSTDTAENRFVLGFLEQLDDVVERVAALARSRFERGLFWRRIALDCADMQKALRPLREHSLWQDVGRLSHLPVASSVLQRRRGYRDVLLSAHRPMQGWVRVRIRVPLTSPPPRGSRKACNGNTVDARRRTGASPLQC